MNDVEPVIIIGASVAGAVAARTLTARGIPVTVIEAREESGGRLWNESLGEDLKVEVGANWVHGFGVGDDLESYTTDKLQLNRGRTDTESNAFYEQQYPHKLVSSTHIQETSRRLDKTVKKVTKGITRPSEDISLAQALKIKAQWEPTNALARTKKVSSFELINGLSIKDLYAFHQLAD